MDVQASSHHVLHAFCVRPNVRFEAQSDNEQVILVIRAHPVTQIYWIINAFAFVMALFGANYFMVNFLTTSQVVFINGLAVAVIFSYLWVNFLTWYFNVGIITNERVVDVDLSSLIYREVTYSNLNKIEDVTSKGGGFIASLFNYGDVYIQTAGTEVNIEYINIPRPAEVAKLINQLINAPNSP
ncbi:PH domain-containing protein [Patescibacteria group bacterium]|nr:PH domain-containing protein [Patescibacteria group bacterium]MCL5091360.1 PH domain-containing protein [Patescibacteria group bacterium]